MNRKHFIDVDEFILKLEWLKEWMNEQIEQKGRWYGFTQYVFIDGFHRSLNMNIFNDFCIRKKYNVLIQSPDNKEV